MPLAIDNITPFSKALNTTSERNATIADARFGAAGNFPRELVLDLNINSTNVIAYVKKDSTPSKSLINPIGNRPDLSSHKRLVKYYFEDWSIQRNEILNRGQVCINDLCYSETDFWALDSEWHNPHFQEGVLGLANDAYTFTSAYQPETILGNSKFSLSYDPAGLDSIFTLGAVDNRYHAPTAEMKYANAQQSMKPSWAVKIEKFVFEGHKYEFISYADIAHNSYDFELPYPVFNRVTNYILYHNPVFSRNTDYMLEAHTECMELPDIGFTLDGPEPQGDFTITVGWEQYTSYNEDTGICTVLFQPSNDRLSFGISLLEKYVVEFDFSGQLIGFVEREVQHSVRN